MQLLLMCVWAFASQGLPTDPLVVTQTPAVSVMEWEAVNISCCWTGLFERLSVNWLKNKTTFNSKITIYKTKCWGSLLNDQCKCATLSFMRITRQQAGTYICRVIMEIPVYKEAGGNGTVVTVTAREYNGDSRDAYTESRVVIPKTRGKPDDTSAGRGRRIVVPETREDTDDTTYEDTAADEPQQDVLTHILRCLPVLALLITFCYLYSSGSKAQPHTPAAPENDQTSAQATDQDQEEEERAERSNQKGTEENNVISED